MNRQTLDTTRRFVSIFARLRGTPAIGGAGVDTRQEAGFMASHYRHARNVRGMGATAALERAKALPAAYVKGSEYYGPTGGAGAPGERGGRWIESPAAMGFRFVGWSDEVGGRSFRRVDHSGWFLMPDGDGGEVARGCVYQMPSRDGRAVYVEALRTGGEGRNGWQSMSGDDAALIFVR